MKRFINGMLIATVFCAALTTATGFKWPWQKDSGPAKKEVNIGYVNWAEGVAVAHLVKSILEDDMNYKVNLTMADVAPMFTAVASGSQDVFVETWLPVTHKSYMKKYGDDIQKVGCWYDSARIGLVVPQYVKCDSIAEMNQYKAQFDGEIIGIDPGAGIMKTTEKAIPAYDLDYKLVSSSGPAMTASLKRAVDKKEWIAVTGWAPHWKFARWDLKFLDDPEKVYGDVETVQAVARLGIEKDLPEVYALFKAMKFNDQQIGTLMNKLRNNKENKLEAARQWKEEHMDLVNSWIGG
ncbi:glycine betaine ABC transporter substrate-binding protein [Kiritimatiella glycovorans]|uniref:Glycine betaine-binding protein OpuAC n=1 Tax=Kiritimatiella glycovorans TaxID=1307763 RepID=A0A0G3EGB6_9BACT|nr:glycine betaine ABC transporter substrate-binding protein [Kiritimatiella glycovorans]AKJ65383.1 Glycine betaine-binding protein OpuAC precursor [Kiritimatiella glycovorans]